MVSRRSRQSTSTSSKDDDIRWTIAAWRSGGYFKSIGLGLMRTKEASEIKFRVWFRSESTMLPSNLNSAQKRGLCLPNVLQCGMFRKPNDTCAWTPNNVSMHSLWGLGRLSAVTTDPFGVSCQRCCVSQLTTSNPGPHGPPTSRYP